MIHPLTGIYANTAYEKIRQKTVQNINLIKKMKNTLQGK